MSFISSNSNLGLNLVEAESSEDIQITVYTAGGLYTEHMDTLVSIPVGVVF